MPTGRFAPSPTGPLHLGNLRTALLAWLFARSAGSKIHLRIEDLDPVASRPEWEAAHRLDLERLGLLCDPPVMRQSERRDAHAAALAQLASADLLYPCWCTRREVAEASAAPHGDLPEGAYPGTCAQLSERQRLERERQGRPPSMRLRSGHVAVSVDDELAGPVTKTLDDFVVVRADGVPAYQLAVVVDDAAQGIEQVVRGDDLLTSTPRQVHLARLLGLAPPRFAHVPLVVGPTGERLAKRDGAVTLDDRLALGDTPAQVLAWLASSLGLVTDDEQRAGVEAAALVGRFAPATVPAAPWTLSAEALSHRRGAST